MGEDAEITIRELSGKRYNDISQLMFDKNGNRNMAGTYDFNLMCCVYGIVDPSMQDENLRRHFGATTPKELAAMLFGMESAKIANEIINLSELNEESEKEVKNL